MKENISIKTKWEDLSLKELIQLNELNSANLDEYTLSLNILSILTDKPINFLESISISDFGLLMSKTKFLNTPIPHVKLSKEIELNNRKFTVILNPENMTAGQFIDFKQLTKTKDDLNENYPTIISLFIIPKGHTYNDGYDTKEHATFIYENIPAVLAYSLMDFFSKWFKALSTCFLQSSLKKIKKDKALNQDQKIQVMKQLNKAIHIIQNGGI